MLIRKFTRNGRDEALAAAVVRALEPRFEAIDRRFEAMDVKWERRFEAMDVKWGRRFEDIDLRFGAMDNRFGAMDVKWERRFVELRNEISGFRGQSDGVREHVARLQEHVDAQLHQMRKEMNEKFAALSATVVHGFDRPETT